MQNDKPSATAILILKSIVFLSLDSRLRYLVPEEISKISVQFFATRVLNQKGLITIFKINWFHHFIWLIEHLLLPGIILHYVLRKRYIEEATLT